MGNVLSHIDENGKAKMVDVSNKNDTNRTAVACGKVKMKKNTLQLIMDGKVEKGDVLVAARIAGIMGSKRTSELIPMCHPLMINSCSVTFNIDNKENAILIEATVNTTGKTGVEMEALTAVSIAALTIYDMCKAVDKAMIIEDIHLLKKTGGKSGDFTFNNNL